MSMSTEHLFIAPDRLRRERLRRALTQAELATLAGIPRETVVRYETGHRCPRPATVRKIAKALKVRAEDIADVA